VFNAIWRQDLRCPRIGNNQREGRRGKASGGVATPGASHTDRGTIAPTSGRWRPLQGAEEGQAKTKLSRPRRTLGLRNRSTSFPRRGSSGHKLPPLTFIFFRRYVLPLCLCWSRAARFFRTSGGRHPSTKEQRSARAKILDPRVAAGGESDGAKRPV
jgi:hypothetical protein